MSLFKRISDWLHTKTTHTSTDKIETVSTYYKKVLINRVSTHIGGASRVETFHPNGKLKTLVPYIDGLKHGNEKHYDINGRLTFECLYLSGKRI